MFSTELNDILQDATPDDQRYVKVVIQPILTSLEYKPKFGRGAKGYSLEEFQSLYQSDLFYNWFGLGDPLMYAAHKAAGGMTSIYRQIGTGCERLIRAVIQHELNLTLEQVRWSYRVFKSEEKFQTLTLDARIQSNQIVDTQKKTVFTKWLASAIDQFPIAIPSSQIIGAVFEVRQGYKSKDSKRQNADISNATAAIAHNYLPVVLVLSSQINNDIVTRYQAASWLILRGEMLGTATSSTYVFMEQVVGYDLRAFFERNSALLRRTLQYVLSHLLGPL